MSEIERILGELPPIRNRYDEQCLNPDQIDAQRQSENRIGPIVPDPQALAIARYMASANEFARENARLRRHVANLYLAIAALLVAGTITWLAYVTGV